MICQNYASLCGALSSRSDCRHSPCIGFQASERSGLLTVTLHRLPLVVAVSDIEFTIGFLITGINPQESLDSNSLFLTMKKLLLPEIERISRQTSFPLSRKRGLSPFLFRFYVLSRKRGLSPFLRRFYVFTRFYQNLSMIKRSIGNSRRFYL